MANLKVIDGGGKKPASARQRKMLSVLRAVMIVLVILLVLFVLARLLSDSGEIADGQYTVDGRNYIYEINADAVLDMQQCNGGLAVLTSNSVLYISRSGSSVIKNVHKYSEPALCVSGDNVLLYDRGGTSYRIENASGVQYEGKTDFPIITAAYGKKGNYALAAKGKDSLSVLTVFSRAHQAEFEWKCASEYLVSIDLSDNGKNAAAAVMNSKNASLYSKVYLFDMRSGQTPEGHDYADAVFAVRFVSSSRVAVLGDGIFGYADAKEKTDVSDFPAVSDRRFAFDADSGTMAVLLAKYGNDSTGELYVYSASGKQKMTRNYSQEINWIACSSRYCAAAYDERVEICNMSGKVTGTILFEDAAKRVLIDGTSVYVLTSNGISVYGVTSDVTVSAPAAEKTTAKPAKTEPDSQSGTETTVRRPIAAFTEAGTTALSAEG